MKNKRKRIGQTLVIGVGIMLLSGLLSCGITAVLLGKETVPEAMGTTICWIINIMGAYAVAWYTAKRSEKNKMQIAAAVIGIYVCICMLMGRMMFPDLKLQMSVWTVMLAGAAGLGGITSCMKKDRKR